MKFNEARKIAEAIRAFDAIIPVMVNDMGQTALNHFTKSFRDQGFTDETFKHWEPRKRTRERNQDTRGILIKSGRLRRSLRKNRKGKYGQKITSNVPYADVHNKGLRSGRGDGFIMPKRQFATYSAVMNRKIKLKIHNRIRSIFPK